jgi:hypothetical protein
MAKLKSDSNKKDKTKKSSLKKTQEVFYKEVSSETKNSFDFGGLPARDFKKNLGCG